MRRNEIIHGRHIRNEKGTKMRGTRRKKRTEDEREEHMNIQKEYTIFKFFFVCLNFYIGMYFRRCIF